LGALDLALELRAQHGHRGARAPCKPPEGAHDAGQALGPRDDEREHGDQHQLAEADVEHLLRLVVVAVLLDAPVLLGLAFLHRILEAFHRAAEIGTDVAQADRKSTRLNSSHVKISYAVFCLKKKNTQNTSTV